MFPTVGWLKLSLVNFKRLVSGFIMAEYGARIAHDTQTQARLA